MIYAKPSTSLLVVFRAYLASDHVTPATGKTIAITISKNGGAFGNPNAGATNATEISSGFYKVTLDTTDTGTAGPLAVRGAVATVDDVGAIFYVGQAPADMTHVAGTAVTAAAGIPEVKVASIAANAITASAIATGAIDADSIAADAITAAKVADGTIDAATFAAGAITATVIATGAVDADALAADAVAEIADGVWDEATAGHATAGSTGVALTDILTDTAEIGAAGAGLTALATQASVNTIDDFLDTEVAAILAAVDTEVAAIKAKTDNLPASPAAVGSAMTLATGAVSADALATDAVTEITDAILALVIETGLTLKNAMRLCAAAAAAKISGAGTTTITIRNAVADDKDRITATVDADGNRSAIVLDLT